MHNGLDFTRFIQARGASFILQRVYFRQGCLNEIFDPRIDGGTNRRVGNEEMR